MRTKPCKQCNTLVDFINVDARISTLPEQIKQLIPLSKEIPQLKKCSACNAYFWISLRTSNTSESPLQSLLFENHTRLKNYEAYALLHEILEEKRQKVTHYINDPNLEPHYQPDYDALKMVVKSESAQMLETAEDQINKLVKEFNDLFNEYLEHLEMLNRIFPEDEQNNILMASKEQKKSLARAGLIIDYLIRCLEIAGTDRNIDKTIHSLKRTLEHSMARFDSKNRYRAYKLLEAIDNYNK